MNVNRIANALQKVLPQGIYRALRAFYALEIQMGHFYSVRRHESVNHHRKPMPWITYPAAWYLEGLDLGKARVFEFGSGFSTLFWMRRGASLTSVEHDPSWYHRLKPQLPDTVKYVLAESQEEYVGALRSSTEKFDIILIDGLYRRQCAEPAIDHLAPGGMVILDNADWFEDVCVPLQSAGFIRVDFSGFGAINGYVWTTSIFLSRDFGFQMRPDREMSPPGAKTRPW